ncbi:FMN-linked oxidoreductase [Ceratobasidium sp. AG-I]|nr:FMN-linked oxidoreductase [Ceratobasidium sp. AG-I]
MPAFIRGLRFDIPLLNSSCPWASNIDDLKSLYASSFTGGVTTRTATLKGFPDDPKVHQVAFSSATTTSLNSYGYSPYPLSQYIEWARQLISDGLQSTKPIIISITFDSPGANGNESETSLDTLLEMIQKLRHEISDVPTGEESKPTRIGVEINTSCPNITNKPPPAYEPASMRPLLAVIAKHVSNDPSLVVGLKLPPYVHAKQFTDVVSELAKLSPAQGPHPIAFLTCTNTLGSSLLFEDQTLPSSFEKPSEPAGFAVPTIYGGLAGESIHPLSLGNVHRFAELLKSSPDPQLQSIAVIGVGGVTSSAAVSRMVRAGATLVECATAIGFHGVSVFETLAEAFENSKLK